VILGRVDPLSTKSSRYYIQNWFGRGRGRGRGRGNREQYQGKKILLFTYSIVGNKESDRDA
jgi:hypothetical protein